MADAEPVPVYVLLKSGKVLRFLCDSCIATRNQVSGEITKINFEGLRTSTNFLYLRLDSIDAVLDGDEWKKLHK